MKKGISICVHSHSTKNPRKLIWRATHRLMSQWELQSITHFTEWPTAKCRLLENHTWPLNFSTQYLRRGLIRSNLNHLTLFYLRIFSFCRGKYKNLSFYSDVSVFHTIALTFGSIFWGGLGCNDFSNACVPCQDSRFWNCFPRLTDKHNLFSRLQCFALLFTGSKLSAKYKNLPLPTSIQRQQKRNFITIKRVQVFY